MSNQEEDIQESSLSSFQTAVALTALKHMISEMHILGLISTPSGQIKNNEMTRPSGEILAASKLDKERTMIQSILEDTWKELHDKGSWEHLENVLKVMQSKSDGQSKALETEINKLKREAYELSKHIQQLETSSEEKNKNMDTEASLLRDDLDDVNFQQKVEETYLTKWEYSRAEQNIMIALMEESRLQNQILTTQYQIDYEDRVHIEITLHLNLATKKLQDSIKDWTNNYIEKTAFYEDQLSVTKQKRQVQLRKLELLNEKYLDHEEKIKEYIKEREEREKEEELQEYLNKMATKIQAWWRGVMVRRHLGSYKKKGKVKDKPKFKPKSGKADVPVKQKPETKDKK